jgi:peptidoglycan/xylan/chitin deacetylase (PgdA/CDA1 family)
METLYKKSFFIVTLLLVICSHAFAGQIAITIDDAPGPDSAYYDRNERTKIIAKKLSESKVQAMFFAIGKNIDNNGIDCLKIYANDGHLIANHSYSHMDLNSVDNKEFSDDILKNQELIKYLSTFSRFFRYPLLHEGNTIQKRDCIRDFLKKQNLRNGYVTVDNWDFFINTLINDEKEKKTKINIENLKRLYIDHIGSAIMFYDKINVGDLCCFGFAGSLSLRWSVAGTASVAAFSIARFHGRHNPVG